MILVTQTSGLKIRIPGLGGAVGNMHLWGSNAPIDKWLGLVAAIAAEWVPPWLMGWLPSPGGGG